jgi:hypothetical protein
MGIFIVVFILDLFFFVGEGIEGNTRDEFVGGIFDIILEEINTSFYGMMNHLDCYFVHNDAI